MTKARKTSDVVVTGEVVKARLTSRPPFDKYAARYSPNTEIEEFYAEFALRTEAGTVYFNSPSITRRVTSCPVCAIVTFSKDETDFLKVVGERGISEPGKPNDNHVELKYQVGQTMTVSGRLKKAAVGRNGPYQALTHCHALNEVQQ